MNQSASSNLPDVSHTAKTSLHLDTYESQNMATMPGSATQSSHQSVSQKRIVAIGRSLNNKQQSKQGKGHSTAYPRPTMSREAYTDIDPRKVQKKMHSSSRGRFPLKLTNFSNQTYDKKGVKNNTSQDQPEASTDRLAEFSTESLKHQNTKNARRENQLIYETQDSSQHYQASTILRPPTTQMSDSSQNRNHKVPVLQTIIQPKMSRNFATHSITNTTHDDGYQQTSQNTFARRAALQSRQDQKGGQNRLSQGAYNVVAQSQKQMRPMTQNQRGPGHLTNLSSMGREVAQLTQTQETLTNSSLYFSKKDRVMQKPVDHEESLDFVNLQIQHTDGSNDNSDRGGSIKLVISKSDYTKQKMMQSQYQRMAHKLAIGQTSGSKSIPDFGSMTPQQIAQVRDKHQLETSIYDQPRTLKSGVFEQEKSPHRHTITTMNRHSFNELALQENPDQQSSQLLVNTDRVRMQMPDIKKGLKSRSLMRGQIQTHNNSIMQPQKLISTQYQTPHTGDEKHVHTLNPKPILSQRKDKSVSPFRRSLNQQSYQENTSLYLQTKDQILPKTKLIESMQSDLKNLIDLEPYAHRTKKQIQEAKDNPNGYTTTSVTNNVLDASKSMNSSQQLDQTSKQTQLRAKMAPKLSNRQIEDWLNETLEFQLQESYEEQNRILMRLQKGSRKNDTGLEDSKEQSSIPTQKQAKAPLVGMEIDRIALDRAGIDQADVDRLYRGLYAGSVGVFDTLKTCLANVHVKEQYQVMGRLWNSFQMLLQHCCPTEFQMIGRKLIEDQIKEINKVKSEFGGYKTEMDKSLIKTEAELIECRTQLNAVSDEKDQEFQKRQESDFKLLSIQTNLEDEVRLRLDFEIKINKLHNLTMALRNHEATLNRRIEELEQSQTEYRHTCQVQQEEIVSLRSVKLQQEMVKSLDDVKIETVQKNQIDTREKLMTVTMSMQNKEQEIAKKTNLTMALQTVVDNRDSRIRALQDQVKSNKQKEAEIDAQYEQYHQQIQAQEKSIKEYMQGLSEQDAQLVNVKRKANEKDFNAFEFQMAQHRVKDLEAQMDKLLESTTDQRQLIDDFTEEVAELKICKENLERQTALNKETIQSLGKQIAKYQHDLRIMTRERDEYKTEKEELDKANDIKKEKIKQFEIETFQLKQTVERQKQSEEEREAEMHQLQEKYEQYKQSALTWESKCHKLQIAIERQEKLATDANKALRQYEKNKEHEDQEHERKREVLYTQLNSSKESAHNLKVKLWGEQIRVMRRSIRVWLLKLFIDQFHAHLKDQQKQWEAEKRSIIQIKLSEVKRLTKTLDLREQSIEHISMQLEDLNAHALNLENSMLNLLQAKSELTQDVATQNTRNEALQVENQGHDSTIKDLEQSLAEIKTQNQALLEQIQTEKANFEREQQALVDKIGAKDSAINELQEQVARGELALQEAYTTQKQENEIENKQTQTDEEFSELLITASVIKRMVTNKDSQKLLKQMSIEEAKQRRSSLRNPAGGGFSALTIAKQLANMSKRSSLLVSQIQSGNLTPNKSGSGKSSSQSPSRKQSSPAYSLAKRQSNMKLHNNDQDGYDQLVSSPMYGSDTDLAVDTRNPGMKGILRNSTSKKSKQDSVLKIQESSECTDPNNMLFSKQQTLLSKGESDGQKSSRRVVLQQLSQPVSRDGSEQNRIILRSPPIVQLELRSKTQIRPQQRPKQQQIKGLLKSAMNRRQQ